MDEPTIGLPLDVIQKQRYLGYYSEWIEIKYEQFGSIPRLPDRIWDFGCGDMSFQLYPPEYHSPEQVLKHQQRELGNVRNAWRLLCNWESNPYRYLESAQAWYELLQRYIQRQGLKSRGNEFLDLHLTLKLNQDQQNILHEMELNLNPAITCVVSMADKLAYVFVCILNELFPQHNRVLLFVEPDQPDRVLERQPPPDVKVGQVYKVLSENKDRYDLEAILSYLTFFVSEDFNRLRTYRNDYIHQFPQRVGHPDQPMQLIYDYVDIAQKKEKKRKEAYRPFRYELPVIASESQHWSHEELLNLTLSVWKTSIEKTTAIFDILVKKESSV